MSISSTLNTSQALIRLDEIDLKQLSSITKHSLFEAAPEDAEAIVHIVNEAFRVAYPFRDESANRTSMEDVVSAIKNFRNSRWYVLKEAGLANDPRYGKVVSSVLYSAENSVMGSIHMFATLNKYRGKGLGETLYRKIEKKAKKEFMSLYCVAYPDVQQSKLVAFYKRLGFNLSGTEGIHDHEYIDEKGLVHKILKPEFAHKIKIVEMIKLVKYRLPKLILTTQINISLRSLKVMNVPQEAGICLQTLPTVKHLRPLESLEITTSQKDDKINWGSFIRTVLPSTAAIPSMLSSATQQNHAEKLRKRFAEDDFDFSIVEDELSNLFEKVLISKPEKGGEKTKNSATATFVFPAVVKPVVSAAPASTATLEVIS